MKPGEAQGPWLASHLWSILERWQVTHMRITMPAQLLVNTEKQESTNQPFLTLLSIILLQLPTGVLPLPPPAQRLMVTQGSSWRLHFHYFEALLNLQWSFILINPFWRGVVLNKNAFNSYVHWHNFSPSELCKSSMLWETIFQIFSLDPTPASIVQYNIVSDTPQSLQTPVSLHSSCKGNS